MARDTTVQMPGEAKTIWEGAGDVYRVLATADDTGGDYFAMEGTVPPGAGPPPHIQTREEEMFFVLEGELTFRAGGKKVVGGPGTFLNIPRDVPHHFKNESDTTARVLIVFAPAGIEAMMEKMAADPTHYVNIGKEYGVEFVEEA